MEVCQSAELRTSIHLSSDSSRPPEDAPAKPPKIPLRGTKKREDVKNKASSSPNNCDGCMTPGDCSSLSCDALNCVDVSALDCSGADCSGCGGCGDCGSCSW
jgi:hypothetical protein